MAMRPLLLKIKEIVFGSVVRRNIGMTLGRQMVAALMQLLVVVIIARELGPEGNGFYAMAVLVPTLLANFLNFGIGPATVYYLGRRDFDVAQVVRGNIKLALIIGCGGVVVALPPLIVWGDFMFPAIPKTMLVLGVACFPVILLIALLSAVLQGLEDFRSFNASVLLPPFITFLGTFAALYVFQSGIYGALIAFIFGQLVALIAISLFLNKHLKGCDAKSQGESELSELGYNNRVLGFGWKAYLSNIITFINYRADILLVNFFLTPAATGIYVIAVQLSEKLWMPSQAVSTVLFPRLSAMKNLQRERLSLTNKGFGVVVVITFFTSMAAAVVLYWFIKPIFGEVYIEVLPVFLWLIPGVVLWAGARVQANCISAAGKPEWNMYVSLCVLSINVAGNIILIPKYGVVGAAWATSSAYAFDALAKYVLVRKSLGV